MFSVRLPAVLGLFPLTLLLLGGDSGTPQERPHGIKQRVPWTTSRITGSPEPPPPYKIELAFQNLVFYKPLLMTRGPRGEGDRFFVGEHEGKIFSFRDDQNVAKADLAIDLRKELHSWDKAKVKRVEALYGLAFHPQFAKNRYCYICYVLESAKRGEQLAVGSRLSRFTVTDSDPPRIDSSSEKILLTWLAGGHNGGDVHFGRDGFLYLSTGDGADPNPPDGLKVGQDLSSLLSKTLRIDVDHEQGGKPYAIPPDNPFLTTPGARPEVWAYGFRNPWRMSFDRATGDLWVGDVGWELRENVYRVQKGGNYGWSIMEGRQPVRAEGKRGPTPILPPTLDFPHTEAASITGGYVYRGKRLKDLSGAYICGDWVTRKLWATKFDDNDRIVWHKEIAHGTQRIVAFGEDKDGELYFVDYDDAGKLYRWVPNPAASEKRADFPTRLSETGLFESVKEQVSAPGVVPFSINAAQWIDHGTAERWLALPGLGTARVHDAPVPIPGGFFSGEVFFPKDGVLAKTISLETERGNPRSRRRLETQILHFDGVEWHGYTYAWNEEQTDAVLVPAAGMDRQITVTDAQAAGGKRSQTWHFPSRTECLTCHNPWAGHTLAFTLPQLQRERAYGPTRDNQVRALEYAGLIELLASPATSTRAIKLPPRLTDPSDTQAELSERARSYLQVNCAHCHRFGGGGTADLELRHGVALERTKSLEVRPTQGTFGIAGAHILSPGDPFRSVLYYRMAKTGPGRMPHIGSALVDEDGLRLMHTWISTLSGPKEGRALLERLRAADEVEALAREEASWQANLKRTAAGIAKSQGRSAVSDDDRRLALEQLRARAKTAAQDRAVQRKQAAEKMLSSTATALVLAQAMAENHIPASARPEILALATAHDGQVRDLFERFLPEDKRVKRLGTSIKPEQILSLKGSAQRGQELFFKSAGLQCAACHKIQGKGNDFGPDLSQIGKKATPAQILESLLEPSKSVDPKYTAYLVETTDGRVLTGLLVEKNADKVILKTQADREVSIATAQIDRLVPQSRSLMPEQLLRDLTAEEAADLVAYLASLK
jgi:putative heme-binding domain-containing protein